MRNEKGIAMVLSLVIIIVLAILASSLLLRGVIENRRTESFTDETRAFWLAQAGMSRAMYELNSGGGAWTGWISQGNNRVLQATLGTAGDYDVTVFNYASSNARIEVIGYYPNKASAERLERIFEAAVTKSTNSLFDYAAYAEGTMTMSGQGSTDSYDSAQGAYGGGNVGTSGDIGTNTGFSGSGQAYVDGDINIPVGETAPGASHYSGSVVEEDKAALTQVPVPTNLTSLSNGGSISSTTTINPGDYQYWTINLSGKKTVTLTGPINLYLTGTQAIKVSGQAKVVIDSASTGPVNIYFDGDIDLTG